jgi:hypothetical protein
MRMADFVLPEALIPELIATNRNEAIREIVESLGACVGFDGTTSGDIARAMSPTSPQCVSKAQTDGWHSARPPPVDNT